MKRSRLVKKLAAAAFCLFGAGAASAETMDFVDIGLVDLFPVSYTEFGYIVTSIAPLSEGPHLHPGNENLMLHSNVGSSPYQFKRVDGASFNFFGFDYVGGDSLFVADNGASFTIHKDQPLASFVMSNAFQNVKYVNWYMNILSDEGPYFEQYGTIDNVVMVAVPEPSTIAMWGLGLLGLLGAARRPKFN
jgi:hypothetical protein